MLYIIWIKFINEEEIVVTRFKEEQICAFCGFTARLFQGAKPLSKWSWLWRDWFGAVSCKFAVHVEVAILIPVAFASAWSKKGIENINSSSIVYLHFMAETCGRCHPCCCMYNSLLGAVLFWSIFRFSLYAKKGLQLLSALLVVFYSSLQYCWWCCCFCFVSTTKKNL